MRRLVCCLLAALMLHAPLAARADAYNAQPKLIVIVVIDQFRADYLERYRDFTTPMGFNLFLKQGAYFTDCYYNYANTMTAPGHSSIGTGGYSASHGIALNEWWDLDRSTDHPVSSVEDERYQVVGGKGLGVSPRNLLASTLGDEVMLASQGQSRLYGISLKDRAAILTSGHASNGAFWVDHDTGHFVSSTYWGSTLPAWVATFNQSGRAEQAAKEAHAKPGNFYDQVGATPASVTYLMDFARALIQNEHLGQHATTDVLTISISSTDILGHKVGPDAPEERALTRAIDVALNGFFTFLDQDLATPVGKAAARGGGMAQVWAALSGDHGIGPTIASAAQANLPAAYFSPDKVSRALDTALNARFSPGEKTRYMLPSEMPYFTLDPRAFTAHKVSEADAENAVAELLPAAFAATADPAPTGDVRLPVRRPLVHTYTRLQMAAGALPPTPEGMLVANSYSPNGGWSVLTAPGMYAQTSHDGTNHYTPYSYDRHVPLAFYGAPFQPGVYHQPVEPIDIAPTFTSLLRINRPSGATGHVLTFALKPGQ